MPSFRRGPEFKLTLAATPFPAAIPLCNTIRRPPQYNTQALKCIFLRRLRNGLQPNWARPRAIAVLLAHAQVAVVCADRRKSQRYLVLKLHVLSIWRVASGRIAIYDQVYLLDVCCSDHVRRKREAVGLYRGTYPIIVHAKVHDDAHAGGGVAAPVEERIE